MTVATAILAILAGLAILYFALAYLDLNLFNVLLPPDMS